MQGPNEKGGAENLKSSAKTLYCAKERVQAFYPAQVPDGAGFLPPFSC